MELTCIACPMGCKLEIEEENGKIKKLSGFNCPRGKKFAETEFYSPQRMVTTIVTLTNGEFSFLPVISNGEVPKKDLKDCIKLLQKKEVIAPIKMGDIIEENILGTGINILAAKTARMGES